MFTRSNAKFNVAHEILRCINNAKSRCGLTDNNKDPIKQNKTNLLEKEGLDYEKEKIPY